MVKYGLCYYEGDIMRERFKRISTIITCFLVIFMATGLVGCGDKEGKNKNDDGLKPLTGCMWEVSKGDKKGYLIGTIHVYKKGYSYTNDNLDKILKETDGLAVEVDITDKNEISLVTSAIMAKPGEGIEDILNPEEIANFKKMCTDMGLVYETLKFLNGYGISSMIETTLARQAGLSEVGYDQFLINRYKENKKEIIGIEGATFQLSLLQDIYNDDSIKDLVNTYSKESSNKSVKENNELFDAYVKGDMNYMDEAAKKLKEEDKVNYDKMLTNRNINMANKAAELIDSGKVYTIAVGAMHYAGEESVIKELESKGYTVTRLE